MARRGHPIGKIKHPGALHEMLGIAANKPIPVEALMAAKNSSNPLERERANFALNARKWHHKRKG